MLKDLIYQARLVIEKSQPTDQELAEAENALSAFLEALATERISEPVDFTELENANRLLREIRRERSRRLAEAQQSEEPSEEPEETDKQSKESREQVSVSPHFDEDDAYDPLKKFLSSRHDPEAESIMDSAEEAFYAGNYQKAIPLFEKVLQIEPGWSRAQKHHDESEEFLRTGNIPSVALPPEAGRAYGKAQSAARVFRYQSALDYLDEAFSALKDAGINRWREGEELRQDLQNQIQANEVYQEGLALLQQGDLQGGLSKVQTAASAVALPEYVDKLNEIKGDIAALNEIADVVNLSGNIPPEKLAEARTNLDRLSIKYGDIPQITRLRNRMEIVLPAVTATLVENIKRLKRQGDSSSTIKTAKNAYTQAENQQQLLQMLDSNRDQNRQLRADIQESLRQIESFEESLQTANQSLGKENRFFPRNTFLVSKAVRSRFPQDPGVIDLKRNLRWYHITLYGAGVIGVILLSLILVFGIRALRNQAEQRRLSMLPTATATATMTSTPTTTPTATETATPTPEVSPTPFYTPSPTQIIIATVNRNLFAYSGCYESTNQVGRIPEGGEVTIIALPERVFDELDRECVLVEYKGEDRTVTGYVLIADLIIP
jgi:tetratricopeptide (TPR) repeat protein